MGDDLVLPSIQSKKKALSDNAMNSALRRMGYTKTRGDGARLPIVRSD